MTQIIRQLKQRFYYNHFELSCGNVLILFTTALRLHSRYEISCVSVSLDIVDYV